MVIVDNGSDDESAAVAREWGTRVVAEPRVGIPFAAATGYDAAHSPIIVRADADTVPAPDWLVRLLERFEHDEALVAVSGPGYFSGLPWGLSRVLSWLYLGSYTALSWLALSHPPLFGTNLAFRRSWWEDVRDRVHLDPGVHDDMDLSFQIRPRDKVVFDWRLGVGMSRRALAHRPWTRWRRGLATIRANWQHEKPWLRWVRLRRQT